MASGRKSHRVSTGKPVRVGRSANLLLAESRERCRAHGLSPSAGLPAPQSHVEPWELPDTGSLLGVLCDRAGIVRGLSGPARLLQQAASAGLHVGTSLAEPAAGTNAVGLAMTTGEPARVQQAEHFLAVLQSWSAVAAPVHAGGRVVGYASVWWEAGAAPGSEAVEQALRLCEAACRDNVARSEARWLSRILEETNPRTGYLVVRDSGLVLVATPTARRLLGLGDTDDLTVALPYLWQQLRRTDWGRAAAGITLRPPAVSSPCVVHVRPLSGEAGTNLLTVDLAPDSTRSATRAHPARYRFDDIITVSARMTQILEMARSAAVTDVPVLLLGESGTGKELVAQAIHHASPRAAGPFVAVNCAALPRELIVSELFGYEEGAFTGARRQGAPGRFEQADGGTLFLDEIGEMAPEHQAMLLRVLEDGYVVRLGGGKPRQVDVRIIAATNRDLRAEVEAGRFRSDLYYRLNIVAVHLPPLRERPEDIPLLASVFLEREARALGKRLAWTDGALKELAAYRWPGNIRELYNVVKRAAVLATGEQIGPELLPWHGQPPPPRRRPRFVRSGEVEAALQEAEGNVSEAARKLGVARSTIYRARKRASRTTPTA